jgi:hypothetical protein
MEVSTVNQTVVSLDQRGIFKRWTAINFQFISTDSLPTNTWIYCAAVTHQTDFAAIVNKDEKEN